MDLLVLNYNDAETTIQYINSVKNFSCVKNILIVDNCSTDDSCDKLNKILSEKIHLISTPKNGGYGYGNNYGIRYLYTKLKSEFILLSNPDVIVEENVLIALEEFLKQHRDYAIVSPYMHNSKKEKCFNSALKIPSKKDFILSTNWLYGMLYKPFFYQNIKSYQNSVMNVDTVAGSLFLMNTEYMLKCGLFDENVFLYWEEIILGMKIKSIQKNIALLTDLSFVHNHSVSINKTYKSAISKQRLSMDSKLYVLRQYYHANRLEYSLAYCLSKLSLIDIIVVPKLRTLWRNMIKKTI